MTIDKDVMITKAGADDGPGMFWRDLWMSVKNPEFWALSAWLDILVRTRRSKLGVIWLLMPSVIYVFVLGGFLRGTHAHRLNDFLAHIALGSMAFRSLISVVMGSANVFNGNSSFIFDGRVRLTDYLMKALGRAFFDSMMYVPVVAIALAMYPGTNLSGLLLAPLTMALIYLNALWLSVLFSMAGARYPDFSELLGTISMLMFLLTPIVWYPESMPQGSLRGTLMRFNPFYHYVEVFRAPIMGNPVEPASWWFLGISTVVGLAVASFVYRRYARFVPLWI